jgi:hypothetical protein
MTSYLQIIDFIALKNMNHQNFNLSYLGGIESTTEKV